jgi:hypothetical protein
MRRRFELAGAAKGGIFGRMAGSEDKPVVLPLTLPLMLPFRDKEGTGWHVTIRYLDRERCVEGLATEDEALEWIAGNFNQFAK